jgi:hypothetical protein
MNAVCRPSLVSVAKPINFPLELTKFLGDKYYHPEIILATYLDNFEEIVYNLDNGKEYE